MKNTTSVKRLFTYIKPYIVWVIISLILAVITVVLSLYIPILIGRVVDLLVGKRDVDFDGISQILIRIGVLIPITAIATYIMNICNNHISYSVAADMRNATFEKLHKLPISYIDSHPSGDLTSRITTDADTVADGLLMGFASIFTGVLTILGTLVFMIRLSLPIAAVVVVVTPLSLLVARFIAKRSYDKFTDQAADRGELLSISEEAISHLDVIRAYGAEDIFIKKYTDTADKLKNDSLGAVFFSSITNPATRFVNAIVYAAVGVIGALYAVGGGISVGTLAVFLSYANQYTKPFNEISGVVTELQNAFACAGRIYEILDVEAEDENRSRSNDTRSNDISSVGKAETVKEELVDNDADMIASRDVAGKVNFEGVEFSYDKEKSLIEEFNLDVSPGSRVAIVGPTGAGKSTVINLLMRFYDVDDGTIFVDDEDIRDLNRDELRSDFGMVLQETWVRSGTVRDNITLGREGFSDEEVKAAAKAAFAHSFIKRLPDGYNTVLSEDGGGLSEGEKQLLCVTRVMLDIPDMLILDEATSSIDTRTEARIGKAFSQMMRGRTSFIVAHRLQTIKEADIILVMKDGAIVEQGSHEELLKAGGVYKQLYLASK